MTVNRLWLDKGEYYADNSIVDPATRVEEFSKLIGNLPVKRILEVGCNRGHNLAAISTIGSYELHGIDPCGYALDIARESGYNAKFVIADAFKIPYPDSYFDLVFTCGVLMHISNKDIALAMREMRRVSNKYVLALEYKVFPLSSNMTSKYWNIVINCKDSEYLVFRDYDIFIGKDESNCLWSCIDRGHVGKKFEDDKIYWWLFEIKKEIK